MQKWEYLFVTCEEGEKGLWRPRKINGQEVPGWKKGMTADQMANQMGELGWELVSVPFASAGDGMVLDYRLIFKRPKSG